MTRDLTTSAPRAASSSYGRNKLDYSRHMRNNMNSSNSNDDYEHESVAIDAEQPYWEDESEEDVDEFENEEPIQHYIYTIDGEEDDDGEHPVYVTSSEPHHSYFTHHGADDSDEVSIIGQMMYLDSKNDLDAARESNKYLQ